MALQVNDFVESVSALVLDGHDREYRIKDGQLVDLALNSTLAPKSIMVDASLRFDSGIDAGDASHIFAITERFALRIGYPDFPKRRSGRTATMLGFDTAEQAYVWLVPSVVRDARLARVPYHGEFATDDE